MKDVCLLKQMMAPQKVSPSNTEHVPFSFSQVCYACSLVHFSTLAGGTDYSISSSRCCFAANQRETQCDGIQLLNGAREGRKFSVRLVASSGECVCNETLEITIGCPCKLLDQRIHETFVVFNVINSECLECLASFQVLTG